MEFLNTLTADVASGSVEFRDILFGSLLAFALGQAVAWVYMFTHSGLSYSRSFVQSIVLLTVIIALSMMVIGDNIVVAFGLIGALAVIRFRNILKDTRDTAFIFFALVAGMASGTGRYTLAVWATVFFGILLLYLHATSLGTRHTGDGFLRFHVDPQNADFPAIDAVLQRHCRGIFLLTKRFHEEQAGEAAYRLVMRDPARANELVDDLRALAGISHLTFVYQEEEAEV